MTVLNFRHGPYIYKDTKPLMSVFFRIGQLRYLAAGVYLSEAPDPLPPPRYTLYEYIPLYLFTQGRGEWRLFTRGIENTNMTDCISSL